MFRNVKNQKGFTLVEVIVVAVIVAVLAAVAIPLYNGYIRDSRINVANNIAGSVASAAGATYQQEPANVPADGDYTGTITFPGLSTENNVINIPAGYTITMASPAVTCTHSSGAASGSYTFR